MFEPPAVVKVKAEDETVSVPLFLREEAPSIVNVVLAAFKMLLLVSVASNVLVLPFRVTVEALLVVMVPALVTLQPLLTVNVEALSIKLAPLLQVIAETNEAAAFEFNL